MSDDSSDGSPARPRKKLRRVILMSGSDEDSDSSLGVIRKRKRLRVMSDHDSESSDSDIVIRRRGVRQLQESEDNSSEWDTDHSSSNKDLLKVKVSGFSSDSSDGNSDKCAICLLRFKQQEVGTPNNCQHYFCIDCITEWSKNVNTCPVDRSSFTSIIVRSSIRGPQLRSVPVEVSERRLSEEILLIEDPTYCQICRNCDREEYMLLCDTCDMGFHMDCLSPPLDYIPLDQWHCPECAGERVNEPDEVDFDVPLREIGRSARSVVTRATPRLANYRRGNTSSSSRRTNDSNEPSTSSASTSRRTTTSGSRVRRTRTRRRTRRKKKKSHRQPRTAARRKLVRASVNARLQSLRDAISREALGTSNSVGDLVINRQRAGIPSLSLFGNNSQLEFFSDDEEDFGSGGVAVAPRPSTSSILNTLRQSRRKALIINSPPHASAAPDILSEILESQTRFHSKDSLVSVTVDGTVNIKLQKTGTNKENNNDSPPKNLKVDKVDLTKAEDTTRKAPSYPGQSRGGNWGGGYRDNYNRNQGNYNNNTRNNNYENNYRGGNSTFQGGSTFDNQNEWQNNRNRNFESDYRQNRSDFLDSDTHDRPFNNRFPNNRGRGNSRFNETRHSIGAWQSEGAYQGEGPMRHSFGGFDDAIDMRMGQGNIVSSHPNMYGEIRGRPNIHENNVNIYNESRQDDVIGERDVNMYDDIRRHQREINNENVDLYSDLESTRKAPTPPSFTPLPEPPVFRFPAELDRSEDEKSDPGLVIDTEKYDPTEPTHGDSSGDEDKPSGSKMRKSINIPIPKSNEPSSLSITSTVLNKAVELVLQEHRNFMGTKNQDDDSDESDGDCPNFSIYSATSVNIANNTGNIVAQSQAPTEDYEDLVQEDDEVEEPTTYEPVSDINKPPTPPSLPDSPPPDSPPPDNVISLSPPPQPLNIVSCTVDLEAPRRPLTAAAKKLSPMDYVEKVSKRCPITPNVRNPINFKLTPSSTLLKKNLVELYDEDDDEDEEEEVDSEVKSKEPEKQEQELTSLHKDQDIEKKFESCQEKKSGTGDGILLTNSEPKDKDDKTETPPDSPTQEPIEKEREILKDPEILTEDVSQSSIISEDEIVRRSSTRSPVERPDSAAEKRDTCSEPESDDEIRKTVTPEQHETTTEIEKLTESISETEDERSYTPCLDENKSKDNSFETDKDKGGIEGLDTEMISEEEGNDIFSDIDDNKEESDKETTVVAKKAGEEEDGEIVEKNKGIKNIDKRKKKKEKKGEKDNKPKRKDKGPIAFKKLSKSTKDRNYRDKDDKKRTKDRHHSDEEDSHGKPKRKEKRKEIERYDVRMVVSEKRRKVKDAFGRDTSRPRSKSPSVPHTPRRRLSRSVSGGRISMSRGLRSISRSRRSQSPVKRRSIPRHITPMRRPMSRSISRGRRSVSRRRSMSYIRKSPLRSPRRKSPMNFKRRSLSPRARKRRSITPRVRRSITPRGQRRSTSPQMRKSISPRGRRSISPRLRKSISPRGRRSISPRVRRSISPRVRRSISPRIRRSISPRVRRSISPRVRRSISPRGRRSISPRVRSSISPRARRRSISPKRVSISPKRRKSISVKPKRSISRSRKRRRSGSKLRKSKSPKKKKRSKSGHRSPSRKRSRSPKQKKTKKTKARKSRSPRRRSPRQKKRKNRSVTPEIIFSPERIIEREEWRNPSPLYRPWSGGSRSINSRLLSPSWTPPREISPDHHYRVMLENEERSRKKQKKRQREIDKPSRHKHSKEIVGPSKEVFTSGNNILVSVSFKDSENVISEEVGKKRKKKDKKTKRKKSTKTTIDENVKPVAIIDLEKSPFREITPSPKNVIVLSDSDHGEKDDQRERDRTQIHPEVRENLPEPQNPPRDQFQTTGPKTPPEPSIKFSITTKSNTQLRPLNPLHEEEETEVENQEEEVNSRHKETHKGPNTPPEPPNSPPSSPDAYDPFEPTKSRSPSPAPENNQIEENLEIQEKKTITLETAQKTNLSADDVVNQRPITPIEKVMALLQSTRNVSPTQIPEEINREAEPEPPVTPVPNCENQENSDQPKSQPQSHFSSATVAPTLVSSAPIYLSTGIPRIGVFTNAPSPRTNQSLQITSNQRIVLPSPTKSSPLKTQPAKLFLAKPSPIKSTPIKPMPSKTLISKLPLPSVKPLPGRKSKEDVIDLDLGMDSPYSPGSSDFGDLFEPPSESGSKGFSKGNKSDLFDSLFGSKALKGRSKNTSATKVPVKRIKKGNKTQVGVKLDEDSLKILDELPSSAVEMQVKSKFLKKLNRQERVVEEVKLVLKPHYNKKHVTKEQYKDILRKTVPKICHNKNGEINPAKIQSLVEAYVKKYRKRNKQAAATT